MYGVILTGAPGAGKSEVAAYLHDLLGDGGADAALVEVDSLERSYPAIDRERSFSHLAMLASSYREVGSEILIVTATIEDDDYRTALLAAAGVDEHLLVMLEADPETMRERILDREPPGWSGLPDLLNASRGLAESLRLLDGVDVTISTEDRRPSDVAAEIELAFRSASGI
jgi:predicted kinase